MKTCTFFILLGLSLACYSCGSDQDCRSEGLEQVIVGQWIVYQDNFFSGDLNILGEIEFRSDGTVIDSSQLLIGFLFHNSYTKTYSVPDNSHLTVVLKDTMYNYESPFTYDIISYSCHKIFFDENSFSKTLIRK